MLRLSRRRLQLIPAGRSSALTPFIPEAFLSHRMQVPKHDRNTIVGIVLEPNISICGCLDPLSLGRAQALMIALNLLGQCSCYCEHDCLNIGER